jgi:hypothetical protein
LRDPFRTLPSLIEIAERSLTVDQLAETDLRYVESTASAADAEAFLSQSGFDAAPIAAPRPGLYVDHAELIGKRGAVLDHARPLDAPHLVSSALSLADGVRLLSELPYYFVLEGDQLAGVVTRADLQRQAVSMVLLGFILASEVGMNLLIEDRLEEGWVDSLSGNAPEEVERIYQERVRTNAEISRLDCLMLHQRLSLLGKSRETCRDLGFSSKKAYARWASTMTRLRDTLAHGGGLLHARPDPVEAIQLFDEVRRFAERVWALAEPLIDVDDTSTR